MRKDGCTNTIRVKSTEKLMEINIKLHRKDVKLGLKQILGLLCSSPGILF